jgi:hypothetical protein
VGSGGASAQLTFVNQVSGNSGSPILRANREESEFAFPRLTHFRARGARWADRNATNDLAITNRNDGLLQAVLNISEDLLVPIIFLKMATGAVRLDGQLSDLVNFLDACLADLHHHTPVVERG